jgi:hypothetical protein
METPLRCEHGVGPMDRCTACELEPVSRDELIELLALYTMHEIDTDNAADAILAAGWRKTVTPEQIKTLAADVRRERDFATSHAAFGKLDLIAGRIDDIARAFGISVAEDGEQ